MNCLFAMSIVDSHKNCLSIFYIAFIRNLQNCVTEGGVVKSTTWNNSIELLSYDCHLKVQKFQVSSCHKSFTFSRNHLSLIFSETEDEHFKPNSPNNAKMNPILWLF